MGAYDYDATGGFKFYGTEATYTSTGSTHIGSNRRFSDGVTEEELQRIREEVKTYMTDKMKDAAREAANELFCDIEKLKKEKISLQEDVLDLKMQLRKTKQEVEEEIATLEMMIERYMDNALRFGILDIRSND